MTAAISQYGLCPRCQTDHYGPCPPRPEQGPGLCRRCETHVEAANVDADYALVCADRDECDRNVREARSIGRVEWIGRRGAVG